MDQTSEFDHLGAEMALIDDEALIVLARECDYTPARDEILVRHRPRIERLIQWLSRSTRFGSTDVDDARQNAVFWTVEAIAKFDTLQSERPRRCSFRSFLNRVLTARFQDFSKHIRRFERRRQLTTDSPTGETGTDHLFQDPKDPVRLAENEEARVALQDAVDRLDDESREIWTRLCSGMALRDVAADLGLSYDAAKRRRRKLLDRLRRLLGVDPETGQIRDFSPPAFVSVEEGCKTSPRAASTQHQACLNP